MKTLAYFILGETVILSVMVMGRLAVVVALFIFMAFQDLQATMAVVAFLGAAMAMGSAQTISSLIYAGVALVAGGIYSWIEAS